MYETSTFETVKVSEILLNYHSGVQKKIYIYKDDAMRLKIKEKELNDSLLNKFISLLSKIFYFKGSFY